MNTSDKEILEAIANHDENAFNEFYKRYSNLLYKWVFNRIGDKEVSKDITQDFWSVIWINPQIIKTNDTGSAKNFMLHFFTYRILDYLRSDKKREKSITAMKYNGELENMTKALSYSHILEEIEEKEIFELIDNILDSLPYLTRQIFNYRWKDNYSIKETAIKLNVDEKTVYNRTFVALKTIRTKIEQIKYNESSINNSKAIAKLFILFNVIS